MHLSIMLLALVSSTAVAGDGETGPIDRCVPANTVAGLQSSSPVGTHPLGEEPPAAQLMALYRKEDGCPKPIVLRKGLGMNKDRQQAIAGDAGASPIVP